MSEEIQYLKYQRDKYGNFLNINYQIFLPIFSYQSRFIVALLNTLFEIIRNVNKLSYL